MFRIFLNINSISYSFRSIANQNGVRYSDSTSYTVHHNTAVQNVNKPFVYITDLTSTLNYECAFCYLHMGGGGGGGGGVKYNCVILKGGANKILASNLSFPPVSPTSPVINDRSLTHTLQITRQHVSTFLLNMR